MKIYHYSTNDIHYIQSKFFFLSLVAHHVYEFPPPSAPVPQSCSSRHQSVRTWFRSFASAPSSAAPFVRSEERCHRLIGVVTEQKNYSDMYIVTVILGANPLLQSSFPLWEPCCFRKHSGLAFYSWRTDKICYEFTPVCHIHYKCTYIWIYHNLDSI